MSHKDILNLYLLERINRQPGLREQIEKLVTLAEAAKGTPDNGNDIEELGSVDISPSLRACEDAILA